MVVQEDQRGMSLFSSLSRKYHTSHNCNKPWCFLLLCRNYLFKIIRFQIITPEWSAAGAKSANSYIPTIHDQYVVIVVAVYSEVLV